MPKTIAHAFLVVFTLAITLLFGGCSAPDNAVELDAGPGPDAAAECGPRTPERVRSCGRVCGSSGTSEPASQLYPDAPPVAATLVAWCP